MRSAVIPRPLLAEKLSILLGRPIVEKPFFEPMVSAGTQGLQGLHFRKAHGVSPFAMARKGAAVMTAPRFYSLLFLSALVIERRGTDKTLHDFTSEPGICWLGVTSLS